MGVPRSMTGWVAGDGHYEGWAVSSPNLHALERSIAPLEARASDEACERTAACAAVF